MDTKPDISEALHPPFREGQPVSGGVGADYTEENCSNAISALMEGASNREAAQAAGITTLTLKNWMKRTEFIEEHEEARLQLLAQVNARLHTSIIDAINILTEVLKTGDTTQKIQASKAILQMAQKNMDNAELRRKTKALEATLAEQAKEIKQQKEVAATYQKHRTELTDLKTSLTNGSFKLPNWITPTAWDKIVKTNDTSNKPVRW